MTSTKNTMIVAAFATALAGTAFAHSGATGVVKTRMDAMSEIAKSMKAIGAMMKGQVQFDAKVAETGALGIAKHADHIPKLFPEGSNKKPSEALPAIWKDWDRFTEIAADMGTKSRALATASAQAERIEAIRAPFGALAKTCKACHSDFRLAK